MEKHAGQKDASDEMAALAGQDDVDTDDAHKDDEVLKPCDRCGRVHDAKDREDCDSNGVVDQVAQEDDVRTGVTKQLAQQDDMTGGVVEHLAQEVDTAGAKDREEFRRARRRPCSRCGLVHSDYMVSAWIYGLDEFDCKVLLPNLEDVKMDGDVILLPAHITKMLDDVAEITTQKAAVAESELHGADVEDSDKVCFVVDSLAGETEVPDSQNKRL